jgi:DNA-directed RNA polymerase
MSEAIDLTIKRNLKREHKTEKRQGLGGTDGAQGLIQRYMDETVTNVNDHLSTLKSSFAFKGSPRAILGLDHEKIALLVLYYGMNVVGHKRPTLSNAMRTIGRAFEFECYADAFRKYSSADADRLETLVRNKHSSVAYRKRAFRAYAQKLHDFQWETWADKEHLVAGKEGLSVLLNGSLFVVDQSDCLTITKEAVERLDDILASIVLRQIIALPQNGEVVEWSGYTLHLDGVHYDLVRTRQKPVRRLVERQTATRRMKLPLEALNHAQAVHWRVDEDILSLVRYCFENGAQVPGLPSKDDIFEPPKDKPWEDMSDVERKLWRRKTNEIATANRGLAGERIILSSDLAMADRLVGASFWTPMNYDYRGRIYGLPHFNFQRADHIRALFRFDEGQVLNEEGLYWLKVHVANCGAFNKIDKAPFDERVAWVDKHDLELLAVAKDPDMMRRWWTKADSPFMFVAACKALEEGLAGRPVHIPVSFDGSCSGLQHLCAMSQSEEARLVNLIPCEKPQDIYQAVATIVERKVTSDLGGDSDTLAKMCLAYGVTRSLVKRNVMTYSYSSKRFGMQQQLMEDTMRPLELRVMSGELPVHPFGEDNGYAAARYLSHHIFDAIEEAISKPAEVMRFLQSIAKATSHEGKPVTWETPLGFPVMMRYPKMEEKRVNLTLIDRSVKRRIAPVSLVETPEIDKAKSSNGIAASFTHSMDATHLQMVVLAAKAEGINSIALVHDSFGCLPNDAPKFREIIKRTFVDLYTNNDVLQDILDRAYDTLENTHKLTPVPHKGSLDLSLVMQAEYAFA